MQPQLSASGRAYDNRTWLSASKWKMLTQCGQAVYLERVLKHPSRPYSWTPRGTAVHNTVEAWEKSNRGIDIHRTYAVEWQKAIDEALEKWPDMGSWGKTPRVKSIEKDLELRRLDGLRQVERYVERALDEADDWRVRDAELEFELEFPGILLRGKLDQVREWSDGDLSLWDLKTGGDDGEDNRQLGVYRLGYREMTGLDIRYGAYWYTKLDRASKSIDLSPYTWEYVNTELQKVKQIVDQQLYLANPSIKNCQFCGVKRHCLEGK